MKPQAKKKLGRAALWFARAAAWCAKTFGRRPAVRAAGEAASKALPKG